MQSWTPPKELVVDEEALSSLEVSLPFDPHELEVQQADDTGQTYERITDRQRKRFERSLRNDTNGDFDTVSDLLATWKDPEKYDPEAAQTHELLAKRSLDIPAGVRNDATAAQPVDTAMQRTFRQLYVATQAFLAIHYGTANSPATVPAYRGIREQAIATLVAQMIDAPGSDRYYFYTSTLSNHTTLEGVGFHHADGVVINWEVPRQLVTLAADRLLNTPAHEDELQVVGGIIRVDPDGVVHEGTQSGETRRLRTLVRGMESPGSLSVQEHHDIADLVEMLEYYEEPVTTSDGADRLEEWFLEVNSQELYSATKTRTLRAQVQYLVEAGQGETRDIPL